MSEYLRPSHLTRMGFLGSTDGENPKEKLLSVWRIGMYTGTISTLLREGSKKDHFVVSHEVLLKLVKSVFFFGTLGTIFISTSFLSARIRDKSDVYNTLVGSVCCLPVFRSVMSIHNLVATAPFGILVMMCIRKLYDEEGPTEFTHYKPTSRGIDTFIWAHNKPVGEPFVKRESTSLFTILQKE